MSWDGYIDNIVGHSQSNCGKVAIIALTGGASWTTHGHASAIKLSPAEGKVIADAMSAEDPGTFQANGIFLEGQKYRFLKYDDGICYGKMKDCGQITMQKTKTAIIIAHCTEGKAPGLVNTAVKNIADYLEGNNM